MAHKELTTIRPAIYARLSNEDIDKDTKKKGASVSIEHQLDILRGYVQEKGWQSPKVFYEACDIIDPTQKT